MGQLLILVVNVTNKVGGPSCLIIAKTSLQRQYKYFGDVLKCPNSLYLKLTFNNLSKLTLFDTSLTMKTQPNIFSFQIWIQVEDNMKYITISFVAKKK